MAAAHSSEPAAASSLQERLTVTGVAEEPLKFRMFGARDCPLEDLVIPPQSEDQCSLKSLPPFIDLTQLLKPMYIPLSSFNKKSECAATEKIGQQNNASVSTQQTSPSNVQTNAHQSSPPNTTHQSSLSMHQSPSNSGSTTPQPGLPTSHAMYQPDLPSNIHTSVSTYQSDVPSPSSSSDTPQATPTSGTYQASLPSSSDAHYRVGRKRSRELSSPSSSPSDTCLESDPPSLDGVIDLTQDSPS